MAKEGTGAGVRYSACITLKLWSLLLLTPVQVRQDWAVYLRRSSREFYKTNILQVFYVSDW